MLKLPESWLVGMVSFVFLIALSLAFNVIGMELFKMQEARNRRKFMERTPVKVRWLAGAARSWRSSRPSCSSSFLAGAGSSN